ncbi:MAG: ATP-binding protein [Lachnospiraceae bacterium]|nr:ATP-binding protein [Lachnospiraceae bacterium]
MRKLLKWFNEGASLKTKILIVEAVFLLVGYGFLGTYAFSLSKKVAEYAMTCSPEELEHISEYFTPAYVSCYVIAVVLFALTMALAFSLTGGLSGRIKLLTRQAEAVANDDLAGIPKTDATDEIGIVTNMISEMTERLKNKINEAIEANSAKTDFLSRMSHDIRTPMNAIRGMVEIIKKNPDDKARIDDCITKIDVSTSHLLVLIDEILDMSKLENGEFELTKDAFNMEDVVRDCYTLASGQAAERDITINLSMDPLSNANIIGCELYTRRVITNILNNAIKFNKEQGQVTMEVYEKQVESQYVTFEFIVTDTGVGISKDLITKVFDPFVQADNGARSHYTGTGLGLSVVKKILEMMGGKINIESEVGVGSVVTFSMNFLIDPEKKGDDELRIGSIHEGIEGARMLLVEDNELNMEIAKYILENWGVVVDTAENGKIALDKFGDSAPFTYDLVLMDIRMPEMDGIEATKAIRNLTRLDARLVPIVALSANTYVEDIKAVKDAGMNDHLAKPIDVDRLYEVITKQKKLYDSKRIGHPDSQLFTGDYLK